jgi:hypothetical protein
VAAAGLLVAAAFLAYWRSLGVPLLSDDYVIVDRLESQGYFTSWGGFLRPLTFATFHVDVWLWRSSPLVMHVENVLIHGLVAVLVFLLARRVMSRVAPGAATPLALGAGLLFVVHPSHSEAVSWIAGRGDLLAAFFSVLFLSLGLAYWEHDTRHWQHLVLMGLALVGGLLSKESALAAPGMLVALIVGSSGRSLVRKRLPHVTGVLAVSTVIVAAYLVVRLCVLGSWFGTDLPRGQVSLSLKQQLHRLLLPGLGEDHWNLAQTLMRGAVALVLCACLVLSRRRSRGGRSELAVRFWLETAGLAAATLLALVTATGLTVSLHDGQGERFLYLATGPLCVAVAGTVGYLLRDRRLLVAVLALLVLAGLWALQTPVGRWEEAGRRADDILRVLESDSSGRDLAILNLPDNYEGAYIFRNGLGEALARRASPRRRFNVAVLSGCDLDDRPVQVDLRPEGPENWRFSIRGSGVEPLRFATPSIAQPSADRRSFLVSRADLEKWPDVYAFHGSGLRRVDLSRSPLSALDD